MTTTPLIAAQYARWKDLSRHANPKACKPWAMRVTDTHDDYGVDGDWLDKEYIDDTVHYDVSGLEPGDIIKVSGASHNNRKHAYYEIDAVTDDAIEYDRLSEADVIERLETSSVDQARELRARIHDGLDDLDQPDLERVADLVNDLRAGA